MRFVSLPLLLALSIAATACGGASGAGSGSSGELASVHDAIPADAAWVLVGRNHPAYIDMTRSQLVQQMSMLSGAELDEAAAWTGIDWSSPDALDATGIDLEGEFAIFSPSGMPIVLFELDDREAFLDLVASVEDANPDWGTNYDPWLDFEDTRSWDLGDGAGIDLGIAGRFAVVRGRIGDESLDVSDDAVARSLRGYGSGERFVDTDHAERLRALSPGEVYSYVWLDTAGFDPMVRAVQKALDVQTTDDASCAVSRERLVTTVPGMGAYTTFDADDVYRSTSGWIVRFSAAGAERMRAAFPPTVAGAMDHADTAAWAAIGTSDLRALVDLVQADPSTSSCAGVAALPGMLAADLAGYRRTIDYNLEFFDGTFGFGLFDVRMAGFLPFVDAAFVVGSENPTRLMEETQELIENNGGRGEVDVDAAMTTLHYDLMHLSITLVKTDSRMVVAVGEVPAAFTNTLATGTTNGGDSPFGHFVWNGDRVRALLDMGLGYVRDNGVLQGEQLQALEASLTQWYRIDRLTVTAGFDGDDLVVTATSDIDPDAAPAP